MTTLLHIVFVIFLLIVLAIVLAFIGDAIGNGGPPVKPKPNKVDVLMNAKLRKSDEESRKVI